MSFTHPKCEKTWTGLKLEHCSVCCETFTNTPAADAHRTGGWGPLDAPRRCLTPNEMRSRPKRPLEQNSKGYWTFAEKLGYAPRRLTVLTQTAEQGVPGVSG